MYFYTIINENSNYESYRIYQQISLPKKSALNTSPLCVWKEGLNVISVVAQPNTTGCLTKSVSSAANVKRNPLTNPAL